MNEYEQLNKYPLTRSVFDYINNNFILFSNTYNFIGKNFNDDYFSFCEELLTVLNNKCYTKDRLTNCIKAFIQYSYEYLTLQTKLKKEGKYLYSSFDEVNRTTYQNESVMNSYYLDGLLLSQLFWPNHYRIGQYFISNKNLTTSSSIILDVPTGSGIYPYYIAKYFKYAKLYSVDISPHAIAYAKQLFRYSKLETDNISLKVEDIYSINDQINFDLITCGELLEHVEDPSTLLRKLSNLLKNDGHIFLTTAIFAAAIDHIYLFKNTNEVRELLKSYFEIQSELILPVSLKTYSADMDRIPINYACLLRKPHETNA